MGKIRPCPVCHQKVCKEDEFVKAANEGELNAAKSGWHVVCYREATFGKLIDDPTSWTRRIYINRCSECGQISVGTMTMIYECPHCGYHPKRTFHHRCESCGYECDDTTLTNRWTCPECGWQYPRRYKYRCDTCGFKMVSETPANRVTCPECGNPPSQMIRHVCPDCGKEETSTVPNINWTCPDCGWHYAYLHRCGQCGFEERSPVPMINWVCPECDWSYLMGSWVTSAAGVRWREETIRRSGIPVEHIVSGESTLPQEMCVICGNTVMTDESGLKCSSFCSAECEKEHKRRLLAGNKHIWLGDPVWSVNGVRYYTNYAVSQTGLTAEQIASGVIPERELCPCGNVLPVENGKITASRCFDACAAKYDSMWKLWGPVVVSKAGFRYRRSMIEDAGLSESDVISGAAIMPQEICANSGCGKHLVPDERGNRTSRWCSDACRSEHLRASIMSAFEVDPDIIESVKRAASGVGALVDVTDPESLQVELEAHPEAEAWVWCKVGSGDVVLDVMAAKRIEQEHARILGWLADPSSYPGDPAKYESLAADPDLSLCLVTVCESWGEALAKEMIFAAVTGAAGRWWRPSPEQKAILSSGVTLPEYPFYEAGYGAEVKPAEVVGGTYDEL